MARENEDPSPDPGATLPKDGAANAESTKSTDNLLKLVENKIGERLLFLKIAIGVVGAIVGFFVSVIVWFISDREIRQHLVSAYVYDLAAALGTPEGVKALDQYMQQTLAYTFS